MKRLPFVVLGLSLCAVVTVCLAQQPQSVSEPTGTTTGFSFVPPAAPAVNEPDPAPKSADDESLRTQLLELVKQKVDMLNGEELQSALSDAQQELDELQGARRLEDARLLLERISKELPNTKAAQKADLILRDWNSNNRYSFPRSSLEPPVDPNAQPI